MRQVRTRTELDRQLEAWKAARGEGTPIGYILSLEGADSLVTLGHLERSVGAADREQPQRHDRVAIVIDVELEVLHLAHLTPIGRGAWRSRSPSPALRRFGRWRPSLTSWRRQVCHPRDSAHPADPTPKKAPRPGDPGRGADVGDVAGGEGNRRPAPTFREGSEPNPEADVDQRYARNARGVCRAPDSLGRWSGRLVNRLAALKRTRRSGAGSVRGSAGSSRNTRSTSSRGRPGR